MSRSISDAQRATINSLSSLISHYEQFLDGKLPSGETSLEDFARGCACCFLIDYISFGAPIPDLSHTSIPQRKEASRRIDNFIELLLQRKEQLINQETFSNEPASNPNETLGGPLSP